MAGKLVAGRFDDRQQRVRDFPANNVPAMLLSRSEAGYGILWARYFLLPELSFQIGHFSQPARVSTALEFCGQPQFDDRTQLVIIKIVTG